MINMTNVSNITSLQGVAYYTNNMVDGLLFNGAMVIFFFIILLVLSHKAVPFESALLAASWSMFIISLFFWFANLVVIYIPMALLVIGVFDIIYMSASS